MTHSNIDLSDYTLISISVDGAMLFCVHEVYLCF